MGGGGFLSGVGEHWIAARGVFDPRPVVSFLGPPEFELPPCVNLGVGEIVIEECVPALLVTPSSYVRWQTTEERKFVH